MRRILLTVVAVTNLLLGPASAQEKEIRAISDKLSESLAQTGKKTVAVVDFSDLQGCVTELGRFIAEELSASLAESGKGIQIVDRTNLKVILQENKLAAAGVIDPSTAQKLGQLAGVDSLITGTLTPFGDSVRVAVKVMDSASARIVAATRGDIARTKAIDELLSRGTTAGCSSSVVESGPDVRGGSLAANSATAGIDQNSNIQYEVRECRANGARVVCLGALTFLGEGSYRVLLNPSAEAALLDDRGNRFHRSEAWIGTLTGGKASSALLPSGIPQNVVFVYDGVTPGARTVSLLFASGFVLRNVTLVK